MTNIDALKKIGGSEWQTEQHHRVYFNDIAEQYLGLSVHYYNTGNISSATLNGERISNAEAKRMQTRMGKVWFCLNSNRWLHKGFSRDDEAERAISEIKRRLSEVAGA